MKTNYDNIHPLSLCTYYLKIYPPDTDNLLSTATGFVYEYDNYFYLITNGHNVTRMNPETNERISTSIAIPARFDTVVRRKDPENIKAVYSEDVKIDLYEDIECLKPKWYVHPQFEYNVDVVAISICSKSELPNGVNLYPINKLDFDDNFEIEVGDDLYILGYPYNLNGGKGLPIWKRGTVATEPYFDLDNLPKFMIDSATKSGMSGSPVIMKTIGFYKQNKVDKSIFGPVYVFAGVYSGRLFAKDSFEAQLGIVWKSSVIEEIINGKVLGNIKFQKL